MARGLTPKQKRFAKELPLADSQKEAAELAGYSPHTSAVIASQNLTKLNIQVEVAKQTQKLLKKADITLERLAEEAAKYGFNEPSEDMTHSEKTAYMLFMAKLLKMGGFGEQKVNVEVSLSEEERKSRLVEYMKLAADRAAKENK